jgi:hypothetical protein
MTFSADKARMVAIELKERTSDLYNSLLPIYVSVMDWTLNGYDPALPLPFEIRVQLEGYRLLELERLRLDEYVKEFLTAQVGDTLTYSTPPSAGTGLADGSAFADGSMHADGSGT